MHFPLIFQTLLNTGHFPHGILCQKHIKYTPTSIRNLAFTKPTKSENTNAWLKAKTITNFNGMNETCYSVIATIATVWSLTHAHGLSSYICTWQRCALRTILPSLNHTQVNTALTKLIKTVAQSVRQVTTIRIPQYLPFSVLPILKTTSNLSLHKFGTVILQMNVLRLLGMRSILPTQLILLSVWWRKFPSNVKIGLK